MVEYLAPGVFVEEVSFLSRSIEGVSTSTTGFVGATERGPVGSAILVTSYEDFERTFGCPDDDGDLCLAVSLFFANGGSEAWIVRSAGSILGDELRALDAVPVLNILCLPGVSDPDVVRHALRFCEDRRCFLLVDPPPLDRDGSVAIERWPGHPNAAVYVPRLMVGSPSGRGSPRPFPPSGAVAGVYARTDREAGVWKAPAGIEARVLGVEDVETSIPDDRVAELAEAGVNAIRTEPGRGIVVWGARTLAAATGGDPEWKYVPVRRVALYLEESLLRGTRWAVFEPNDEPVWAKIRLSVDGFLGELWREGALQGRTQDEAWFVRCDRTTTSQADVDKGIVHIVVGFAPLRPAEFVVIDIAQAAARWTTEPLGEGPAGPNQVLPLPRPVGASSVVLLFDDPNGTAIWKPVSNLADAGPDHHVFELDRESSGVRFGDGTHGAEPPRGTSSIRAAYSVGVGKTGWRITC